MSYDYKTERPFIFTEEGQVMFLKIRDTTKNLIERSGAATREKILSTASVTGSSWSMLACIDRLIELGELREVTNIYSKAGQYNIYISSYRG